MLPLKRSITRFSDGFLAALNRGFGHFRTPLCRVSEMQILACYLLWYIVGERFFD